MEKLTVYAHPTCSTCKRALKWLDEQGYPYDVLDIRQQAPTQSFFQTLFEKGVSPKSVMNTSGELYRELALKDKLLNMSHEEIATLLSKNGMLIKRPIIWYNNTVTFGAREKVLEENWRKQ